MKVSLQKLWVLVALSLLAWVFTPAHAQRVALLVGNASYATAPLRNPPNDVRERGVALRSLGFKVQTALNVNQKHMKRAVRDFGKSGAGRGGSFFVLFGTRHAGRWRNHLLPIGASIEKEADYEVEAVSANALMRQIAGPAAQHRGAGRVP